MTKEEITVLAGHRIVSPWVMKLAMDVAKAAAAKEREVCANLMFEIDLCGRESVAFETIRNRGEA